MKSGRSVGFGVVWAFVAGGISGGGLWWIASQFVVNGRSILNRAGFPLNTPIPFIVVGAVLTGISVLRSNRRSLALREELRGVAGELGLVYEEGQVEVPLESRPKIPLVGRWTRCENRLSGKSHGAAAQMFDLTAVTGQGDGTMHRPWTVVLFEQTDLPVFNCLPNVWWTKGDRLRMSPVNFDTESGDAMTRQAVAEFQKAYQVCLRETASGSEEDEARRLFLAPLMAALARHPGWCIQSGDGCLVLARRGIAPAAERATLWREAGELRRVLLAPASSAVVPIPAAPGMERGRELNRRAGRAGGGIAGAVLGFFGSFITLATLTLGRRGPQSPLAVIAVFPMVIGSVVVGALVGTWLGRWLADRTFRPAPDGAPAPGIARGWVIAGAFGGWILGIVVGMGLVTLIPKQFHSARFMPIVFFSPPVLLLILGGFAGNRFGRGRQSRRTGA
jgi:hypothetical protein